MNLKGVLQHPTDFVCYGFLSISPLCELAQQIKPFVQIIPLECEWVLHYGDDCGKSFPVESIKDCVMVSMSLSMCVSLACFDKPCRCALDVISL